MGTPLHGKDGQVKVGGSVCALVDSWSADAGAEFTDVTSMDSGGWQREIAGVKKVTGSIKVRYAEDDTNGITVLMNNAIGGTAVGLSLFASGTAKSLAGTAFLNVSVDAPHDDVAGLTFDFESTGAWTYS